METHLNHPDARRRQLAAIHVAKRDLGLDDDSYRAVLWAVCRVKSAADLDDAGRRELLDHFRARGFKASVGAQPRPGRPHNLGSEERGPQLGKIEALLAAAGRPWAYADGMSARMFHVDRVAFCTPEQLHKLTAALVYDAKRHGRKA